MTGVEYADCYPITVTSNNEVPRVDRLVRLHARSPTGERSFLNRDIGNTGCALDLDIQDVTASKAEALHSECPERVSRLKHSRAFNTEWSGAKLRVLASLLRPAITSEEEQILRISKGEVPTHVIAGEQNTDSGWVY